MNIVTERPQDSKIRKLLWKKAVYEGRKDELQRQVFLFSLSHSDLDAELTKKYRRLIAELQDCELCLQAIRNLFGKYE